MGSKDPKTLLHVKIGERTREVVHFVYILIGIFAIAGVTWLINYLLG